jgi:hypothetical protein
MVLATFVKVFVESLQLQLFQPPYPLAVVGPVERGMESVRSADAVSLSYLKLRLGF